MSTRVELYNSKQRPNKALSYDHMFGDLADNPVRTALLMPSSQCIDVIYLLEKGVITTDTHLYVVEQDGDVFVAGGPAAGALVEKGPADMAGDVAFAAIFSGRHRLGSDHGLD